MRLPLTPPLSTKDGVSAKNARLTNCLKESKKSGDMAVVRPGLALDAQASGVGNGLVVFNDELVSVYGTTLGTTRTSSGSVTSEITQTSMPSTSAWGLCAYGAGVFCIIASASDESATSSDGITWSPSAMVIAANWTGIAYGAGVFCAVADCTVDLGIATSADGITWDYQVMPTNSYYTAISYGAGVFCAVTTGNDVAVSADGATWNTYTGTSAASDSIAYGASVFCAVGPSGAMTSPDGITWTARTISSTLTEWSTVAWNGSLFVATRGGVAYSSDYATSPDGITWTVRQFPHSRFWLYASATTGKFLVSAYLDSMALVSEDGVTWGVIQMPFSSGFSNQASNGTVFAGVSNAGGGVGVVVEFDITGTLISTVTTVTSGTYDFAQSPL